MLNLYLSIGSPAQHVRRMTTELGGTLDEEWPLVGR